MMNENQFCVPLILRAQPPYLYKEVPLPPPPLSPPTKHHSTDWAIGSNVLNDRHNKTIELHHSISSAFSYDVCFRCHQTP